MSQTIWVTGASGFTGKYLIESLREKAGTDSIIAISRKQHEVKFADVSLSIDITDSRAIQQVAKRYRPDQVYHLAGLMPPNDESAMFHVNVSGTYALMNALCCVGAVSTRVLVVGSAAEYFSNDTGYYREDNAIGGFSPYGRAKSAQTMIALAAGHNMGIDVVVARPFNLVGPGLSRNLVVGEICAQLAEGKHELTLGNTLAERDFIDVRDAASAYIALMEEGEPSNIYNVCTGVSSSIEEVVKLAGKVCDLSPEVVSDSSRFKPQDVDKAYGDPGKTYACVAWRPLYSLADSIRDMVKELRCE